MAAILVDEHDVHHYSPDTSVNIKRNDIESCILDYTAPDDIFIYDETGAAYYSDDFKDVTNELIAKVQWAGINPITNSLVLGTTYSIC